MTRYVGADVEELRSEANHETKHVTLPEKYWKQKWMVCGSCGRELA
jgi:hypothetical protein